MISNKWSRPDKRIRECLVGQVTQNAPVFWQVDGEGDLAPAARRFCKSERGGILALWSVLFVVLLGIMALSFDIGRMANTQTELQSFADHVALTAAGELDGSADAITRATTAADLIVDSQTFGEGGQALGGATTFTLTFYSAIPAADITALGGTVTTDSGDAKYVRVTTIQKSVPMAFAAAFAGLTGNAVPDNTVSGTAVAGMTQFACDVTPLMFCIPDASFDADLWKGRMILLRGGGNGAAWGPGDFGFLDPNGVEVDPEGPCAGLNGGNLDRCLLGAEGVLTQCYSQDGVDIEPGQKVGIEDAIFNVRFDIYKATMNGKKNNPYYPPAPNVIKGIVPNGGGSCIGNNEQISPDTVGLPRDACFGSGTCPSGRFGDGNWAAGHAAYMATNYDPALGVIPNDVLNAVTRFELYKAELAWAAGGDILLNRDETGVPECSSQVSNEPEKRRNVIAAGINCLANPINGAETGVPVYEFVEMFLTEPVGDDGGSPPTLDLWVEIVGSAGGGTSGSGDAGIFRDVAQLYR